MWWHWLHTMETATRTDCDELVLTPTLKSLRPPSLPWCSWPRRSAYQERWAWTEQSDRYWSWTPAETPYRGRVRTPHCWRDTHCSFLWLEKAASSSGSLENGRQDTDDNRKLADRSRVNVARTTADKLWPVGQIQPTGLSNSACQILVQGSNYGLRDKYDNNKLSVISVDATEWQQTSNVPTYL